MMEDDSDMPMDQERKIRREIANSNERRRMQSINAGFQSLRTLLPQHEGEKLSKAAILQQTAEYIYTLEQEKTRLLAQNCQLKRLLSLNQHHLEGGTHEAPSGTGGTGSPHQPKRPKKQASKTASVSALLATTSVTSPPLSEESRPTLLPAGASQPEAQRGSTVTTAPTPSTATTQDSIDLSRDNCRIVLASEPTPPESVETRLPAVSISTAPTTLAQPASPGSDPPRVIVEVTNGPVEPACLPVSLAPPERGSNGLSYIVTETSKQNLDSIVEAIKHLEGDELFQEGQKITQRHASPDLVEYTVSDLSTGGAAAAHQSIIILKNCK